MYLTDERFHIIKPLLPTPRGDVEISHREIMEALLYLPIEGGRWRALPRRFGKCYTVYRRIHRWAESGVFSKVMEALRERNMLPREASIAALGSTVVKVHKHASGAPKKGDPEDWSISWRSDLQDTCDLPFGITGTVLRAVEWQLPRCATGTPAVDQASTTVAVLADGQAYEDHRTRRLVRDLGCEPVVPPRRNRTDLWEYDRSLYKQRNIVERFFGQIKEFRRVATRYDKLDMMYMALLNLASLYVTLRQICVKSVNTA